MTGLKSGNFGIPGIQQVLDWNINLGLDVFEGIDTEFKFGRVENAGTSQEVIWDLGGEYVFLDDGSPEQLSIVSDDATDANGLAGAWNVFLWGLDGDYNEISELVTLNGLTPVITTQEFLRLFRMSVIHAGTITTIDGNNAGTITASAPGAGVDQAAILPGNGQTLMCVYTVAAGKTALVTGISINAPQGKSALVRAKLKNCFGPNCAFVTKYTLDIYQSTFFGTLDTPFLVPEKSDIVFTAEASIASTGVGASWGMKLIDNDRIQDPNA